MPSVLQPWVERLGLRHQGVLLTAVRGCDTSPKEDAAKALVRGLRGTFLVSYDKKPSSFIEYLDHDEVWKRMYALLKNHDHYPWHYLAHLVHASEIVGYKHPDKTIASIWLWFYKEMARAFHMTPETEYELDKRLKATEDEHENNSKVREPNETQIQTQ